MDNNYFDLIKSATKTKKEIHNKISFSLDKLGVYNINITQFLILKSMGDRECTSSQIADINGIQGINPTYNLTNMYERGYITAKGCQSDKRKVYYKVSLKGKDLCNKVDALMEQDKKAAA